MRTVIIAALAGLLASSALSATAGADVLNDEIARLVATHPRIKSARADVSAAEKAVDGALAGYFPTVVANSEYGYERVDSPGRRAINNEESGGPRKDADINITENLFNGFLTKANHQSAAVSLQLARAALSAVTQDVTLEGVTAYLDVLRRRELVALAKGNEETIKQQLELEDERVERGAGISVDVLLAKSRLQASKERRVAFVGELENAITRYTQVFDSLPPVQALNVPALPVEALPVKLTEAVEVGLAEAPRVIAANRQVDLADVAKDQARAGYYPTFDVVARSRYENDLSGVIGTRRDISVLLRASWELANGFATTAAVAEASFRHQSSLDSLIFENRQVIEAVKLAWQDLITARERVALLINAVNIATEVHASFRKLRDAGQATIFEVLDALNEIFDAQINAANAAFDARVAVYRVLRAVGRLDTERLAVSAGEPAEDLVTLSKRLQTLDDNLDDAVAIDEAAATAAKKQQAQLAALSVEPPVQSEVERAQGLAPAIEALPELGAPPQGAAEDQAALSAEPPVQPGVGRGQGLAPAVEALPELGAPPQGAAEDQAALSAEPPAQPGVARGQGLAPAGPASAERAPSPAGGADAPPSEAPYAGAPVAMPRVALLAIEPTPLVTPAVEENEASRETVFIASDGFIVDDPNFQRHWSYDY